MRRFKYPFVNIVTSVIAHFKGVLFFYLFRSLQPFIRAACCGFFIHFLNINIKNFGEFKMNLIDYGYISNIISEDIIGTPARVTAVHKERYELFCEYGECFGHLKSGIYFGKGNEEFPTTGDFVLINYNNTGESQIIKTLPRKSFFSRRDPSAGRGEQAIAANFDYVFIMQSLNYDFNPKRLERYLTLSWQSGAVPIVILTKSDLTDNFKTQLYEVEKIAIGADVFAVSAKTGYGLKELSKYLIAGKTIVFLGSSGVGKSSLVNALAGKDIMTVKEIREDDSKGRHTTTHRQLIRLDSGVMIIDTPGMRELGMWDVSIGLGEAFNDVEQYFDKCKYYDCNHISEPDCGIKAAIESGELSLERWKSYLQLKKEAKYTDDKTNYLKEKQQWHKQIAKLSRNIEKNGKN
jgi:ribosome biogenesis GTPase